MKGRRESVAAVSANKIGGQSGVLFKRDVNVRARLDFAEEMRERGRPKRVKVGDEVSAPSAIKGLIAIGLITIGKNGGNTAVIRAQAR
jgi:hypothetical protein